MTVDSTNPSVSNRGTGRLRWSRGRSNHVRGSKTRGMSRVPITQPIAPAQASGPFPVALPLGCRSVQRRLSSRHGRNCLSQSWALLPTLAFRSHAFHRVGVIRLNLALFENSLHRHERAADPPWADQAHGLRDLVFVRPGRSGILHGLKESKRALNVPFFPLSLASLAVRRRRAPGSSSRLRISVFALLGASGFGETDSLGRVFADHYDAIDHDLVAHDAVKYGKHPREFQGKDSRVFPKD